MPVLARFERELADEAFLVIGVHSPKFPNERDAAMVEEAVARYAVHHPVVVDSRFSVWQSYGVSAWPTLVLIDPEGYVVGYQPGEPPAEPFLRVIHEVLDEHRAKGTLRLEPLPLRPPAPRRGSLAYPGKVARDRSGDRLFIADTGHGAIVELRQPAGAAVERRFDGFSHPNGMALVGDTLYVAETGNHAIGAIDLATGTIERVAGTGEKGAALFPFGLEAEATQVALRSPWDLAWDAGSQQLLVAMAGSHQIWSYDPARRTVRVFAGSGREARVDGAPAEAAFAQPSGIATSTGRAFVADSEISAVRELDLRPQHLGRTMTVCGGDLFDFGDVDGVGNNVRLQHPIGIAVAPEGAVLVADTYNHKIKSIDAAARSCNTLYGDGRPWRGPEETIVPERATPGAPLLHEPEGLAVDEDAVWVADTNNHRVLRIDRDDSSVRVVYGS